MKHVGYLCWQQYPYKACDNDDAVAESFRMSAEKLFKDNQLKDNIDRFHLILGTEDSNQIQTVNSLIKGILCEKLLGVKFDHKLAFDRNIKSFCKKGKSKIKGVSQGCSIYCISEKVFTNKFLFYCTIQLLPSNIDDS